MSVERPNHPMDRASAQGRTDFAKAADPEREARRESFMVKRQAATPVQRPRSHLALGPDGAAFNEQWETERRNARKHNERSR